jgi:hypothetical protein
MGEYHKIHSLFKRDPANKYKTFLMEEYARPEFEYLADNRWLFSEKVDGTNIRITWDETTRAYAIGGRTDNAQIPAPLIAALQEMFKAEEMAKVLTGPVTIYGEGYGGKIQKGSKYNPTQTFVLFDILAGDVWLARETVRAIAGDLGIKVVPLLGEGSLRRMVELCQEGFSSQWGDFPAEGIVARPACELRCRLGKRVIAKLKLKDFQ